MMVLLAVQVECSAKIAMTALHSRCKTMRLLPDHDLPRLIFLDADGAQIVNLKMGRKTSICTKRRLGCHRTIVQGYASDRALTAPARKLGLTIPVRLWHTVPKSVIPGKPHHF
jgi:hypothetical protein